MSRICGSCQLCCTLLTVSEIEKPIEQRCVHQCQRGCAIHDTKPDSCAAFECAWLQGQAEGWGMSLRPDRCGVVFYIEDNPEFRGRIIIAQVDPQRPRADTRRTVSRVIDKLVSRGQTVGILCGRRRTVHTPHEGTTEWFDGEIVNKPERS